MHISIVSFSHDYADYITGMSNDRNKCLVLTSYGTIGSSTTQNLSPLYSLSNNFNIRISVFPIEDIENVGLYHVINDSIKPEAIIIDSENSDKFVDYGNSLVFIIDQLESVEVYKLGKFIASADNEIFKFINKTIGQYVNKKSSDEKTIYERLTLWENNVRELSDDVKGITRHLFN